MCRTSFDSGIVQLSLLCDAMNFKNRKEQIIKMFHDLSLLCNAQALECPPRWSGISDDCSPFEFSIVISKGHPSIRIGIEAQADPASPVTYWKAGLDLNKWLSRNWQVDLRKFHKIKDLFLPVNSASYWSIWHGIEFPFEGGPFFKIYLNPLAQGNAHSNMVIHSAITRFGYSHLWNSISHMRGPNDLFTHFSLDLCPNKSARIKVYIRHYNAKLDELDNRCNLVDRSGSKDWSFFSSIITGNRFALTLRPIYTVYHISNENPDRLSRAVLNLPVFPYAKNDYIAHRRILHLLKEYKLPNEAYSHYIKSLTNVPLEHRHGIHSYISFQRENGEPRVTIYFGAQVYSKYYRLPNPDPQYYWPSPFVNK